MPNTERLAKEAVQSLVVAMNGIVVLLGALRPATMVVLFLSVAEGGSMDVSSLVRNYAAALHAG